MTRTEELVQSFLEIFHGCNKRVREIPGKPVPASRPRVTRWGTYYAKTYKNWREAAHSALEEVKTKFSGQIAVLTQVVAPRPKTTKRSYPNGDIDNYEKAAWDAVTKCSSAWDDDDQITVALTTKRYAEGDEDTGIFLTIYEIRP